MDGFKKTKEEKKGKRKGEKEKRRKLNIRRNGLNISGYQTDTHADRLTDRKTDD